MQVLYANRKEEFIFAKLKKFYNKRKIKIKYIASYIYKKNSIIKQDWQIIVMIKDSLLIDSGLALKFYVKAMNTVYYL